MQILHVNMPAVGTQKFARFPGTTGDFASTADDAAFSAPTDFSLLFLGSLDDWSPVGGMAFLTHFLNTGNQRAFSFLQAGEADVGNLRLSLSTNGSTVSTVNASAAHGFTDGTTHWILVTRASGSGDVKFYTAPYTPGDMSPPAIGSFTQLGTTQTGPTGALHNSTTSLIVGATAAASPNDLPLDGDCYRAQFYTGIYGSGSETLVRDFNPTDAPHTGVTTWVSAATGETWTLNGGDPVLIAA